MADAPLKATYAEADVTPPLGGSMPGYFRDRLATGVLDPLKAKVLFLSQGEEQVALVACDDSRFVERLREHVRIPVVTFDERFTTDLAQQTPSSSAEDARAAAHLLSSYLAWSSGARA